MTEQDNCNQITFTDLEALNAEKIKGGERFTFSDEEDEEVAGRRTTVAVKIRRPGK